MNKVQDRDINTHKNAYKYISSRNNCLGYANFTLFADICLPTCQDLHADLH